MAAALVHPLFGVALTLLAYCLANRLWMASGRSALLHPVLIATILVVGGLVMLRMDYAQYFAGASLLNEALGLIIVLLAVPLYRQWPLIRHAGGPVLLALLFGSILALATAVALPVWTGAEPALIATLAPKSSTAAVAAELAQGLGGVPGLTVVVVISTGIFGAVAGLPILRIVGVSDPRAQGFALGVASHAIGTARAFQISDVAGAFASLGMILNALLTILLVPLALTFVA